MADEKKGAVIFDRDIELNLDVGHTCSPDQIRWNPRAAQAVPMVNEAGLFAFVATNQSAVARCCYTGTDLAHLHRWMNARWPGMALIPTPITTRPITPKAWLKPIVGTSTVADRAEA